MDRICFMAEGRVAYIGDTESALKFFAGYVLCISLWLLQTYVWSNSNSSGHYSWFSSQKLVTLEKQGCTFVPYIKSYSLIHLQLDFIQYFISTFILPILQECLLMYTTLGPIGHLVTNVPMSNIYKRFSSEMKVAEKGL